MPPIVINSAFRSGQNNSYVLPLHKNSIHCHAYSGKNALANAAHPYSSIHKPARTEPANRITIRHGAFEHNAPGDRLYTSNGIKNNFSSPSRPGYSPKTVAFAPGLYCRKMDKQQSSGAEHPRFGNSFSKTSSGNIKYHVDKERVAPSTQQFSSGIVGTVLTTNGPSKLTYYQSRDVTLEWPLHSNYKQQRRVCSALASKRKVPSVIS